MCWPNRSVLNIGLWVDVEESAFSFELLALAEDWWARTKRSEVARGMVVEGKR